MGAGAVVYGGVRGHGEPVPGARSLGVRHVGGDGAWHWYRNVRLPRALRSESQRIVRARYALYLLRRGSNGRLQAELRVSISELPFLSSKVKDPTLSHRMREGWGTPSIQLRDKARTIETRYDIGATGSGGEDAAPTAAGTAALQLAETFVMGFGAYGNDFVLDGGVRAE